MEHSATGVAASVLGLKGLTWPCGTPAASDIELVLLASPCLSNPHKLSFATFRTKDAGPK